MSEKLPIPAPSGKVKSLLRYGIENVAQEKLIAHHKLHKDGSECVYIFCQEEHDEYEVDYERKAIKKIVNS